jgi:ubiquinone/menaquinone biosynthesis C-methylase UbiE
MSDIKFTGERYIPSEKGIIRYEHLHRYFVCLDLVVGKSVVDIACGEGYGSYLLAGSAESVIGIDIDPECISHANNKHNKDNLTFLLGSCDKIPVDSQSVDIVISFETIEHHDKHEEMISEIKRILKSEGVLLISSPNRLTYSDIPNCHNHFHIKELYYDELSKLLNKYFNHVNFYGQKTVVSSLVLPIEDNVEKKEELKTKNIQLNNFTSNLFKNNKAVYFLGFCSDYKKVDSINLASIFYDNDDDIIDSYNKTKEQLQIVDEQVKIIEDSLFFRARRLWLKIRDYIGISPEFRLFRKVKK